MSEKELPGSPTTAVSVTLKVRLLSRSVAFHSLVKLSSATAVSPVADLPPAAGDTKSTEARSRLKAGAR